MVKLPKSHSKIDFQTETAHKKTKISHPRENPGRVAGEPREVRGVSSAVVGRPWGGEGEGLCETSPLGISNFYLITLRSHHRWCGGLNALRDDRRTTVLNHTSHDIHQLFPLNFSYQMGSRRGLHKHESLNKNKGNIMKTRPKFTRN